MKKRTSKKTVAERPLSCPRCDTVMQKLKKKDVILDVCPSCKGMWLDAGEIEKLAKVQRNNK